MSIIIGLDRDISQNLRNYWPSDLFKDILDRSERSCVRINFHAILKRLRTHHTSIRVEQRCEKEFQLLSVIQQNSNDKNKTVTIVFANFRRLSGIT